MHPVREHEGVADEGELMKVTEDRGDKITRLFSLFSSTSGSAMHPGKRSENCGCE